MLTAEEAAELSRIAAAPSTPQARALRARIILLAGEDTPTVGIAERLGASAATVAKWRRRSARTPSGGSSTTPASPSRPTAPRTGHRGI
ncbi:helix-turn-helix domain-containing protein [Nocardiopsis halophila]|uniref:helix-turn-helix domain-containing protein n=1 Tax=Nocardiopsis halophila TaxID=141692 RepID=UPI00373AF17D